MNLRKPEDTPPLKEMMPGRPAIGHLSSLPLTYVSDEEAVGLDIKTVTGLEVERRNKADEGYHAYQHLPGPWIAPPPMATRRITQAEIERKLKKNAPSTRTIVSSGMVFKLTQGGKELMH